MGSTLVQPMSAEEYFAVPALSNSGMKDLAVSPLRFWFKNVNPNRPADEPTPEMQIGSALHCAVLEPDEFGERYACEIEPPEGCLVTVEDIRTWLRDKGMTPKGTRKSELVTQALNADPSVPIFDVLEARHVEENAGKAIFKAGDWERINGMTRALLDEPRLQAILAEGEAEVALFATDAETGVALKGKLDWITPKLTLDLKSFSQKRGKSIDQSVADAIWYEGYHGQAVHYATLRGWPGSWAGEHVIAFVESDAPHEVRLKALRPKTGGQANLYWDAARMNARTMIRTYRDYMKQFGVDRPWRYAREIDPLEDQEMKGLVFG